MRPGPETGRRAFRLRGHRGARLTDMAIFKRPALKAQNLKKREMPQGLWQKCPGCSEVVHEIELAQNQRVCPRCEYHFHLPAKERIANLLDPESFSESDANLRTVDTLQFQGMASYKDRLKKYQESTGLPDSVVSGQGQLEGYKISIAVMDFSFMGGSMGSVAGERVTRAIEWATANRCPVLIVSASGGARMYEGMLSLMQMAKTSGALARHACERLPFISVLTNPTLAGVMASFASLGDIILAEPGAMVGFAGQRVIKETTHQNLPKDFQTAEFLEEHGLIDLIVHRKKMRAQINQFLRYFSASQ
jgi:acetyl-CoA carboxylase carboxyl transferase subunit beta